MQENTKEIAKIHLYKYFKLLLKTKLKDIQLEKNHNKYDSHYF